MKPAPVSVQSLAGVRVEEVVEPACLELYEVTRRLAVEYCELVESISNNEVLCAGEDPPEAVECVELRATRGGEVLGILDLVFTIDSGAVIHWVYVLPWARGRGLGTLLVKRAVELARRRGARYVQATIVGEDEAELLGLDATPQAMRRILEKLGFKILEDDVYVLELRQPTPEKG